MKLNVIRHKKGKWRIKCEQTKYRTMDSYYDFNSIYKNILFNYNEQPVYLSTKEMLNSLPLNHDFDCIPCWTADHKVVYWGYYNEVNKFRCLDACSKVNCVHGSAWCSNSNYGHVTKTRPKIYLRYILSWYRRSKTWQKIYYKRTSVERNFTRLKENLSLKNIRVKGKKKVKNHILLNCNTLITAKITLERLNNQGKEKGV